MIKKNIFSFKLVTPYKNYQIPNVSSYKSLFSKIQNKILNLSYYSILFMLDNRYIPLSQKNFQTFSIQKNKIIKLEIIKERAIINYEKLIYDINKNALLSFVKRIITEYRYQIYKRAMTLKNEGLHSSSSLIKNNLKNQRMDFHKTKADNPLMISSLEPNCRENLLDFAKSNTELTRNPSIYITKKNILPPSSNQQSNNFMSVLSEQQQKLYYKTFNEHNENCSFFHFFIDLNKTQDDTAEMRIPMKTNVNRLDLIHYERTINNNVKHLRIKSIENSVKIIFDTIQSYVKGDYFCEIQIPQEKIILKTISIKLTIS